MTIIMVTGDRKAISAAIVVVVALLISFLPTYLQVLSGEIPKRSGPGNEGSVPFEVVTKAPEMPGPGGMTVLECSVQNIGRHTVKDIIARIVGTNTGPETVVEELDFSGSASRDSGGSHGFTVKDGAAGLVVSMSEDPGPLGRGDAGLSLRAPSGESYMSSGGGPQEEIALDEPATMSAGPGTFGISVDLVGGLRPVAYTIAVRIEYWNPQAIKLLDDLGPGEKTAASWNLTLPEGGLAGLKASVKGTVQYSDIEGEPGEEYTVERAFVVGSATRDATTFEIKPYRNGLGYVLVGLMSASLLTGISRTRNIIPNLKGKAFLKVHCIISWAMVTAMTVHAWLASLTHPWTSPAVITGESMAAVFWVLTLIPTFDLMKGGFRLGILEWIGRKQYMAVNRAAILMTLAVLAIHIYA